MAQDNMPSENIAKEGTASNPPPSGTDSAARPTLPPNVSIFSPPTPAVSEALLLGRIFTRLTISLNSNTHISDTLLKRSELETQQFWLVHQNVVLVFDSAENADEEEEKVKDRHHEHVRSVCLALKDGDLSLSIAGCVFDAKDAVGAGFQFDRLSGGAVLVIDLMDGGDEEEEEGSDDGDEDFDLLAGGETVA